jgi:hypothetical protein
MSLADDVRQPLMDEDASAEAVVTPEIDGEGEAECDIEEDVDTSPLPLGDALVVAAFVAPLECDSKALVVSQLVGLAAVVILFENTAEVEAEALHDGASDCVAAGVASHAATAGFHGRPGAQAGFAVIRVQAAPSEVAPASHAPAALVDDIDTVRDRPTATSAEPPALRTVAKAASAKHDADATPWQRRVPPSHPRPCSQSVAASGARAAEGGLCAARARSQAAHGGAGTMPSAAALPSMNMMPLSVANARERTHCVGPPMAAYAAQAESLAKMMSKPCGFSDDAAGRKSSGVRSITLSAAGNAMIDDGATVALYEVEELHANAAVTEPTGGALEMQAPVLAAVASDAVQQRHAPQPGVCSADDAQQQPDAQRFVWQSKLLAHAWPGKSAAQPPPAAAHELQFTSAAKDEQQ